MRNVLDKSFRVTAVCRRLKSNPIKSSGRTCRVLGRACYVVRIGRDGCNIFLVWYLPAEDTPLAHSFLQQRPFIFCIKFEEQQNIISITAQWLLFTCWRHISFAALDTSLVWTHWLKIAWSTNMWRALIEFQHNVKADIGYSLPKQIFVEVKIFLRFLGCQVVWTHKLSRIQTENSLAKLQPSSQQHNTTIGLATIVVIFSYAILFPCLHLDQSPTTH